MSDHLAVTTSDGGFDDLPALPDRLGGHVKLYESSLAEGPHVLLEVIAPKDLNYPNGPTVCVPAELTADTAWKLSEQLRFLLRQHYQGDATPEAK